MTPARHGAHLDQCRAALPCGGPGWFDAAAILEATRDGARACDAVDHGHCGLDQLGRTRWSVVRRQIGHPPPARESLTCHAGNTPKAGLLLTEGNSHANLVGQPSGCNMPIVVPGAPEGSYLIHNLTNHPICFGGRMPPSSPLTTSQLQTVTDWICAGALDD